MSGSRTKRSIFLTILLGALVLPGPSLRAENESLDLPSDLEAEQQRMEQNQPPNPQQAQAEPPQGGGGQEPPPPDLGGGGQGGGAQGADQGPEPDLEQQSQQADGGNLPEPTLNPASGGGGRRAASNPEDNAYAQPGDNPSVPNNVSRNAASFSDDEDFLRSQDTIADSNEEDSPHKFHAALVATGPLANSDTSIGLGVGIDFEATLDTHWALGLLGTYVNSFTNPSVNGNATLIAPTVNYYSRRPYEGIWVQFGIGPEFASGGGNSNVAVPLFFSIGWRFLSDSRNLTFAFGLGPQLFLFQTPASWVPMVLTIDVVGVAWNVWPH